ncbi:MAG: Dabb family protein [Paenibacillus sp.]|nr:Dabb family protein [Paenibacillus sp.]
MSIIHSVIFNLKHEPGSADEQRFLQDGREELTSIPTVRSFQVLRQVSPKNDYAFGFSMEFEDEAAYEAYNVHPQHVAFVENRWQKEVTRFLEIDYRAL